MTTGSSDNNKDLGMSSTIVHDFVIRRLQQQVQDLKGQLEELNMTIRSLQLRYEDWRNVANARTARIAELESKLAEQEWGTD